MFVLVALLGFGTGQQQFPQIMACYLPLFGLYWLACSRARAEDLRFWMGLGLAIRLLLVFSTPGLSNDVYRFIWDGRLLVQTSR